MRATYDIDIVAQLDAGHAQPLAAALGPDWYANPEQIVDALLAGRPFVSETQRSTPADFAPGLSVPIASPQDCLLARG